MSTPNSSAFKSIAVLLVLACSGCSLQVHERVASADVFVPCWGDAPPRMHHVDWALSQSGVALDLPARERMLRAAQRICATGARYADFVLQPAASPGPDRLLTGVETH